MLVFQAETGARITVPNNITTIGDLRDELSYLIPAEAQILLTADGAQWKGGGRVRFV
jgi:hypothetical protein